MLFKLSYKNIKKSFKDYTIYFLTLMLGVAIFYVFNSLDSQQAMMKMSESTKEIVGLMLNLLAGVSIFVSFILGFLIIYANRFLIRRRKKEFGIYMTLGMAKRQISRILVGETLLVGIFSLVIGLVVGIFASQLMSVVVAKMFATNMDNYQFVFSKAAMLKTVLYFGIMYVAVVIFNTFSVSKYKLIDLIAASKKNESIKLKNPILCVILFIVSIGILGFAYYMVVGKQVWNNTTENGIYTAMGLGALGTFLFFWSLSGFMLKLVQLFKKAYYHNLNMFVLRQINSKVNTTVFSMTVICLLLFVTIGVLSSALSLNNSLKKELEELTPVDFTLSKYMDDGSGDRLEKKTVVETLNQLDFNLSENFKEYVEITTYQDPNIKMNTTLGETMEQMKQTYPMLVGYEEPEELIKLSDFNEVAKLYGHEPLSLASNEYLVLCDYEQAKQMREQALEKKIELTLDGKTYLPKQTTCVEEFIEISNQRMNIGIFVFPDEALENAAKKQNYLNAIYAGETQEQKQQVEQNVVELGKKAGKEIKDQKLYFDGRSKTMIYDSANGLGAIATFIGLYLGVIFLISGAAILALKELSESSDNKERYMVLRKIGADEKMIRQSLFRQIGIFFILPLLLAVIHSIFGLQFANQLLESIGKQNMLPSIMVTAVFLVLVYGGYFIATYVGSKNIIKEK